jgi:molecular chaperone DnaK
MTDDQVAELKAANEKLQQSAQKVFSKMYEQQAQAQGAPQQDAGAQSTSNDDDVVDADFKEV